MKPGQDLNIRIATEILGYKVMNQKGVLNEARPTGVKPLKNYSQDIGSAFEVAQALKISLIPVVGNQWFAFIGANSQVGWQSPISVLRFLEAGDYTEAAAAIDANPAYAICLAAINHLEKKRKNELKKAEGVLTAITPEETTAIH